MRKIKCDEILNKNDFLNLNDKEFRKQVEKFCYDKINEYEISAKKIESLTEYPSKQYEIFKLDLEDEGDKIFVLDTKLINYNGEEQEKELYYSRLIAKRICENLKRLNEDAALQNIDTRTMFLEDIKEIEDKNKELKTLDEDEYNLDRFIYNSLSSDIIEDFENIQNENISLEEENQILKEKLKKSEKVISELSNKLKISLNDIEENRKKLKINNQSIFEKIFDRIKEILK